MKFSVEKEDIIHQLQSLAAVADKKQTLPILSNVYMRCENNKLVLKSTDLEVELEFNCPANTVQEGEITIPSKKVADIVKELPEGTIEFEFNDDSSKMQVQSSTGKYNLATQVAGDFPDFDTVPSDTVFSINSDNLTALIQKTSFAMANQDWRHYLNGCLIQKNMNEIIMVATDAHRLAVYKLEQTEEGEFSGIIPRKTIIELMKILPKGNEEIQFYINANNIVFMYKNFTFKSKLVDGNYPDFTKVIPTGNGLEISLNRKSLIETLSRVSVLSSEKFKGVKLKTKDGKLEVSAHNPDQESAEESLELDSCSDGFDVAFNVNYLREVLSTIEDEKIKLISFGADKSALIESTDEKQTLVLMPLLL
tara:strand:- start:694 stop:1788 length:1095 start_codon:yes stop_codon:yes gene_type:complete